MLIFIFYFPSLFFFVAFLLVYILFYICSKLSIIFALIGIVIAHSVGLATLEKSDKELMGNSPVLTRGI